MDAAATDTQAAAYRGFAPLQRPPETTRRVWTVFVAFVAAALSSLLFTFVVLGVFVAVLAARYASAHGHPPRTEALGRAGNALMTDPAGLLGSGLAACLSFAFFALVPASLSPEPLVARLRLGAHRRWFAWGLLAALGMLGVGQVCSGLIALAGLEHYGALALLQRVFEGAPPATLLSALAIVGVGAGVGEELFFRGYVQTRLARRWRSWVAVVVTAALFGLMHMDPIHSTFAFLAGLLLGWVSLRTGSVRTTIVAHVTNNVVSVFGMALSSSHDRTSTLEAAAEIALGAAFVAVCVLGFRRASAVPEAA